jgi:hypothetical protein
MTSKPHWLTLSALTAAESLEVADEATQAMKFAECVPHEQLALKAGARFGPGESADIVAPWPVRIVVTQSDGAAQP